MEVKICELYVCPASCEWCNVNVHKVCNTYSCVAFNRHVAFGYTLSHRVSFWLSSFWFTDMLSSLFIIDYAVMFGKLFTVLRCVVSLLLSLLVPVTLVARPSRMACTDASTLNCLLQNELRVLVLYNSFYHSCSFEVFIALLPPLILLLLLLLYFVVVW